MQLYTSLCVLNRSLSRSAPQQELKSDYNAQTRKTGERAIIYRGWCSSACTLPFRQMSDYQRRRKWKARKPEYSCGYAFLHNLLSKEKLATARPRGRDPRETTGGRVECANRRRMTRLAPVERKSSRTHGKEGGLGSSAVGTNKYFTCRESVGFVRVITSRSDASHHGQGDTYMRHGNDGCSTPVRAASSLVWRSLFSAI